MRLLNCRPKSSFSSYGKMLHCVQDLSVVILYFFYPSYHIYHSWLFSICPLQSFLPSFPPSSPSRSFLCELLCSLIGAPSSPRISSDVCFRSELDSLRFRRSRRFHFTTIWSYILHSACEYHSHACELWLRLKVQTLIVCFMLSKGMRFMKAQVMMPNLTGLNEVDSVIVFLYQGLISSNIMLHNKSL